MTDLRDTNSCLCITFNTFFYVPGGYSLQWPRREGSAQKGRLFQVSGIKRERERYITGKGFHKLKYIKG